MSAESPAVADPNPDAVTGTVLCTYAIPVPMPESVIVLNAVSLQRAALPVVADPEPVANRMFPCTVDALELDDPDPVANRFHVCRLVDTWLLEPLEFAVL
jgi:hypothetical protein